MSNTLNWRKEYHLRDHLGNTRLTFADKNNNGIVDVTNNPATNEILQELHYYPFGLAYEGPWLMNDAARDEQYRYNGKEWDVTMGLYDYGARYYDPAVGRWGQVDAKPTYSLSNYVYVANSPILNVDLFGDTLRAVNEISGQRALSTIQNSFSEMGRAGSTVAGLFRLSSDGRTFTRIDSWAFLNAIQSLPEEGQALAFGYFQAINEIATNVVELVNRDEDISEYGQHALNGIASTGVQADEEFGGGKREQAPHWPNGGVSANGKGDYAIIILNSLAKVSSYSDGVLRASKPGELLAHELLGHGLGGRATLSDGSDQSIQAGNLFLRATNAGYYRRDHGVQHSSGFNPNQTPVHLRNRSILLMTLGQ